MQTLVWKSTPGGNETPAEPLARLFRFRTERGRGPPHGRHAARRAPHPCSRLGAGRGVGRHPTMARTHRRACALSVMSGKCRCSSTTPASSPPSSQARRIAVAVSSSTTNMPKAWVRCVVGTSSGRAHGGAGAPSLTGVCCFMAATIAGSRPILTEPRKSRGPNLADHQAKSVNWRLFKGTVAKLGVRSRGEVIFGPVFPLR